MTQVQTQTVTVYILDKEYHIVCPTSERINLERAATYLDGKMREIRRGGKVIGSERIAVLAALNITHELQNNQQQFELLDTEDTGQVRELLAQVNTALAND